MLRAVAIAALAGLIQLTTPGGVAIGAPPTDEQVATVVEGYTAKVDAARKEGQQVTPDLMKKLADEALTGLAPAEMSTQQIGNLVQGRLLPIATGAPEYSTRLRQLATDPGVAGAEAAVLRASLLRAETSDEGRIDALTGALRHPGLKDLLADGKGAGLFSALRGAAPEIVGKVLPDLLAIQGALPAEMPGQMVISAAALMDTLMTAVGDDQRDRREPTRVKLLAMTRAATTKAEQEAVEAKAAADAAPADETLKGTAERKARTVEGLARTEKKLDGAYMRGQLVGHPAPEIDFLWSSTETPIASLADLRGKIVALDFWATWCGPCVGSFPDVAKLQAHYDGFPVVILGVTSIQGRHHGADGKRIDTAGNPEMEMQLMPGYIKEKAITWTIAFGKQDVFNPDYGINGIPHVAILDAKGIVRHRALHPNSKWTPFEEKVQKIDALLQEAGLPTPPGLPPAEKPAADQQGG